MATKKFDIAKQDQIDEVTIANGLASEDNADLGTKHVRVVVDTTLSSSEVWTLLQRVMHRAEQERGLFAP